MQHGAGRVRRAGVPAFGTAGEGRRGAALGGEGEPAADDERCGERHPGARVACRAEDAHQGRAGQIGHAVGEGLQGEGGGQQRHGPGMCAQRPGKHPRLPEPVDKAPDLGPGDGVRDSEPAGDETRGRIRPGACVHQPDDADPCHGDAHTPDSGGKEEGRGTRSAQQSTVVRRSRRRGASLLLPGGTRQRGRRRPDVPTRGCA